MYELTVIGLGSDEGDLTLKALEIIKNAKRVVVRTQNTLSFNFVEKLKKEIISLDSVYEKSRNFNTLNLNLCKSVLDLLKSESVVYLVDGSALEDSSVKELLKKVKNAKVIAGVCAKEKCLERLKISSTECYSASAYDLLNGVIPTFPAVIYAIDSVKIASELKLKLIDVVGEEQTIYLSSNSKTQKIRLYELDRIKVYDYSTSIFIPEIPLTKKERFTFYDLIKILRVLRSENGCPWDKEQTAKSIEKNLLEETYELLDAIELDDDDLIIEEAGDVLLQVAFYCLFGEEAGVYNYNDVISNICSKLISRHTHVFGEDKASNSVDALKTWNKNKAIEKGYNNGYEYLDSVPKSLPALMRAQKIGSRAGKYNFDFSKVEEVFDKIYEEIEEIKLAVKSNNKLEIENECGDLLFSAVNAVRKLGVDAETALIKSTNKFLLRFKKLEEYILKIGKDMKNMDILELDKYYEMLKAESINGN